MELLCEYWGHCKWECVNAARVYTGSWLERLMKEIRRMEVAESISYEWSHDRDREGL
jgi:hypothetical protein